MKIMKDGRSYGENDVGDIALSRNGLQTPHSVLVADNVLQLNWSVLLHPERSKHVIAEQLRPWKLHARFGGLWLLGVVDSHSDCH
jgi:hypothetical protein